MYIREVQVKNFGKLKNQKFCFSPGLNVIYGENGAGKSTLQQFLCAMLFGMEKSRGRGNKGNPYERYEPWEAPGYYAGSMRFRTGDQDFYLERNFYHKEKSAYLVNERDGEELSVEQGDLQMLLGGVTKEAYENTYFIRQGEILPKAELGDCLRDELHNLAQTGDGSFGLSHTLAHLQRKQKELEMKRRQELVKKTHQMELLNAKAQELQERREKLFERYRGQKEQLAQLKQAQRLQAENRQQKQAERGMTGKERTEAERPESVHTGHERKKRMTVVWIISFLILSFVWILLQHLLPLHGLVIWIIGQALLAAMFCVGLVSIRNKGAELTYPVLTDTVNSDETEQVDFRVEISKQQAVLELLTEELQENETELENNRSLRSELEEAYGPAEELDREIMAITLARESLQALAAESGDHSSQQLELAASEIFAQITGTKYEDLTLSEKFEPQISENYRTREADSFSAGTKQQAYFAFRMAAGDFLEQEEPLPFLLDEVFSMYDEKRLRETLCWLGDQKRQIFLFTCQNREMNCLQEMGIPFFRVEL